MANPVVLPADVVQVINMIKSTYVDPNDFQNAVQECFNRGFGKQGQWLMDHKETYLQALQDGYVSELDVHVPISEHPAPPSLPPIIAPAGSGVDPILETSGEETSDHASQDVSTSEGNTGNVEPPGEDQPEGKKRKPK